MGLLSARESCRGKAVKGGAYWRNASLCAPASGGSGKAMSTQIPAGRMLAASIDERRDR